MGAAAHVKKGDEVVITAGDYRGKTGKIVKVDKDRDRVTVQGAGIEPIRKTLRPTRVNPQGGVTEIDRTFHISNVSPTVGGKPTRVRFEVGDDGSKKRVAARDGSVLHTLRKPRGK
mgnify:CR=1 FL=1